MKIKSAEQRLAKRFGEHLRRRRKKLGYTQDQLGSMIGVNRRFISELERGKGTSYLGPSLAAAEALGVNISSLLEEHDNIASSILPPA